MDLQKSAVQSFRASFSRTKNISSELSSVMKNQVDHLISLDNLMSNNSFLSKKQSEKHIISSDNLNKSEEVVNTEKLFQFGLPDKIQDYLSETRLLLNDLDVPKSKAQNLSSDHTLASLEKNKNVKKKVGKKKKSDVEQQIQPVLYDPHMVDPA